MKRLILFLSMLAVLLLTACNEQKEGPSVPEAPPTTVNVKVDFSVYTPDDRTAPLYTRLSPEPIKEFTPFTSPGAIYPFAGQFISRGYSYCSYYDPRYENNFTYGFVDGSGTIVADPVYTTVAPLEHAIDYTGLPFWYMSLQYDSADPHSFLYGLASMDGTFALPCRYEEILGFDGRIIAFYPQGEGDPASFEVYDFDGNLCFTSRDLPFAAELGNHRYSNSIASPYSYSEGLYTIPLYLSPERAKELGTRRRVLYYMTEEGEFLYGPFSHAEPFSDGVAIVEQPHAYSCTYLRRDGTLFSRTYHELQPFRNGSAVVSVGDTALVKLIDHDENVLLTAKHGLYPLEDGSLYTYTYSIDAVGYHTDHVYTCYDRQGQVLWEWEGKCDPLSSSLIRQGDTIVNPLTGKSVSIPYDSAVEYYHSPSDPYVIVSSEGETKFLDKDLQSPAADGYLFAPRYYYRTSSIMPGELLAKGLPFAGESDLMLYRTPGSPIGTYPHTDFSFAQIYPDHVVAITDEHSTYLYDADGHLFFSFPLDPMDD